MSQLSTGSKRKRDSSPQRPLSCNNKPSKRVNLSLKISIPSLPDTTQQNDDFSSPLVSGLSEPDSLFDEISPSTSVNTLDTSFKHPKYPAIRIVPPIHGLFFDPTMRLPEDFAERVTQYCMRTYFDQKGVNQIMLFGRFIAPQSLTSESTPGLPPLLHELLSKLEVMLLPFLTPETHELLFPRVPSRARQAILNLYQPGEGITPHVDLRRRFGDGIIGVSLGSGCVMQFARVSEGVEGLVQPADSVAERNDWDIYLPERSVIVLSEDARYKWTHGIGRHKEDFVALPDAGADDTAGQWIKRGVRLSITFRWLLPGADVVGEDPS